jgi:hypothetical protein
LFTPPNRFTADPTQACGFRALATASRPDAHLLLLNAGGGRGGVGDKNDKPREAERQSQCGVPVTAYPYIELTGGYVGVK